MLLSKNLRENILQTELCKQLGDRTLSAICDVFHANTEDITDITVLKKGMTNRSFIFRCNEKRYIIRISGTGTDKLIDRYQEKKIYETIRDMNICDPVIYINPEKGYKITEFLEKLAGM